VILVGMAIAFGVAVYRLSPDLSFANTLSVAGKMGKLEAVNFSVDPHKRYTFWSGLIGGFFLALSYFGADQSQVQRYLAGGSLKESRLGLLFNATVKVPMQFFILLLGAIVFMFYQFEKPPAYFNQPAYQRALENGYAGQLAHLETQSNEVFIQKREAIQALSAAASADRTAMVDKLRNLDAQAHALRDQTKAVLVQAGVDPKSKESDYVFITFILQQMPHGIVGLLIAVILCATMSAMAATLNALGSTTAIDFYRPLIRPHASDHHYVIAAQALTAVWGLVAIGVASFASLVENLIEAGNILGSVFYGSILGLFLTAFFLRRVKGSAVFVAALVAQTLVFILFATTNIGYLWYNFIGCAAVLILAPILQQTLFRSVETSAGA
jgi:solute:Na+ symporter, SSS family